MLIVGRTGICPKICKAGIKMSAQPWSGRAPVGSSRECAFEHGMDALPW